jgi:hypothetical protein
MAWEYKLNGNTKAAQEGMGISLKSQNKIRKIKK